MRLAQVKLSMTISIRLDVNLQINSSDTYGHSVHLLLSFRTVHVSTIVNIQLSVLGVLGKPILIYDSHDVSDL